MHAGDRLVCVLPQPLSASSTFKIWPLHVTIVPWFRTNSSTEDLVEGLQHALGDVHIFTVHMGEEAVHFGHQKGKLATLVHVPSPLTDVEQRVRDYLHAQQAWLVDESTRDRRNYRPHVTAQGTESLHKGDSFAVDRLYIVEQVGTYKQVVGEVMFSHE